MAQLSELQKRIGAQLQRRPGTMEEMQSSLKIGSSELSAELKQMLKLGLIEKLPGFPIKYALRKGISSELERRKGIEVEDPNKLRLKIIIEIQAIEENLLKKQIDDITKALGKEETFTIYALEPAEIIKEGEHYSSYLDVNLSVKNFKALVRLMFFYGPTSVEVIKPKEYKFSAADLQDALVDFAQMVHNYTEYITKLMNRKELDEFYGKVFGP
ncbi:MAG: hypothetical protein J4415_03035 [Candidatus Diapherotrites archaeon]|uniref:Uncharacterized protein n=1 Tax=Candidatus Iainarchaeum sp. TaxID=3101447 RepID=A0A8T4KT97_9ARCH|nr:hypothetical protein [Candidatus Diapherotrites archaeon]